MAVMEATDIRERVKRLVDIVPAKDLETVARMIGALAEDPVLAALENAPFDDEELSEETLEALKRADEDIAAGRVYSDEEVKRRLGL